MNERQRNPGAEAPQVQALAQIFAERHRFSKGLVDRAQATFGPDWTADFEGMLGSLFRGDELAAAAKGYAAFAFDSMRRQKAFEEARVYPAKSHAQAASEVYFNEEHMAQEYLPGLLLSHYLWPHHYRQLQFFDRAFLEPLGRSTTPRFAEVGIGTALYSRRILERVGAATGSGYDISPASCSYAARHVASIGAGDRYAIHCRDILAEPMEPVPWLVCVEVLEHLEDPVAFLRALHAALRPGGRAFITAAVSAAHSDHIYLYRSAAEVEEHLGEAGFAIEQAWAGTAFAPPAAGVPVPVAAAFTVFRT